MPTVHVVGVGKERHTLIWSMGLPEKATPTRATMGPMALCRRTLGGDAIGTQFLRETYPIALFPVPIPHRGGKREEREGPVSTYQIQPGRGE